MNTKGLLKNRCLDQIFTMKMVNENTVQRQKFYHVILGTAVPCVYEMRPGTLVSCRIQVISIFCGI